MIRPSSILLIAAVAASARNAEAADYTVKDLGSLGNTYSDANDINAQSQIVGLTATMPGFHGFLYDGTMHDLGLLQGGSTSVALAVNSHGLAVGQSYVDESHFHAATFSGGTVHDLGTLGGLFSSARAINDSGQIVGYALVPSGAPHAFITVAGAMQELAPGIPESYATDINNSGQVVGSYYNLTTWQSQACLFTGGGVLDLEVSDELGGPTYANAINASGQIIGSADLDPLTTHAFLYDDGSVDDLGTLGGDRSNALGINDYGVVVGVSDTEEGRQHAFIDDGNGMCDLNDLISPAAGWELMYARAINDYGQIVGYGVLNHLQRAFLLTPAVPGDANGDSVVNGLDISLVASHWLAEGDDLPGDANGDGLVNGLDIALTASNWLHTFRDLPGGAAAVPEPASVEIAVAGLAMWIVTACHFAPPKRRKILVKKFLQSV